MKSLKLVAILSVAGMVAAAAHADVTPIGPFTGSPFENFEDLAPPGGYPGPYTILGGAARINDSLANTFVVATSVASAETNWENFFPYNGFLMGLIPTGWTVFEFDPPVARFGGYFGSAAIPPGGTITFKDSGGAVIGSLPITIPSMAWQWRGWQSDVAIARIEILADPTPGRPLVYDDLVIGTGAAPCYANCDGSTTTPVLNVLDFICFQTKYAQGDSAANCDNSTTEPVLNVLDFICFQSAYATGCP
jgi:hypothetical protein